MISTKRLILIAVGCGIAGLAILAYRGSTAPASTGADGAFGPIGINLYANVDYGTGHIWADASHAFRAWGQVGAAYKPNAALTFTSDGYPLQDADSLSYFNNYPNGVYKLTWAGTGNVTAYGIGKISDISRQQGGGSADVTVKHDEKNGLTGGMLFLGIRNNVPLDPVHDIHLWCPGYKPGEMFTHDFVRRTAPFGCIRFMDWAGTNNSPQVSWSDRVPPQGMIWTTAGVSWEAMIDLANVTGSDMWVNVPAQASDDYVRQLAILIKGRLSPTLKVRVEYSNEVWNSIFQQFGYNLNRARKNADLTKPDDFGRAAQEAALRAKEIGDIFRSVWIGTDGDRLIPVLGGQASNNYWHDTGLQYIKDKFGDPSQYFKEIAIAPYVGDQLGNEPAGGWTLDGIFGSLENFTSTTVAKWTREAKASADGWKMGLDAYEGGQDLLNSKLPGPMFSRTINDPRMYVLYRDLVKTWHANGGGLFCEFSHIGTGWGLLETSTQPGSPEWDATMSMVAHPGDINLDGKVDFTDFQLLKAFYGRKGVWWEEGDFNHDDVVDRKDFDILYANLAGLTPEQKQAVEEHKAALGK